MLFDIEIYLDGGVLFMEVRNNEGVACLINLQDPDLEREEVNRVERIVLTCQSQNKKVIISRNRLLFVYSNEEGNIARFPMNNELYGRLSRYFDEYPDVGLLANGFEIREQGPEEEELNNNLNWQPQWGPDPRLPNLGQPRGQGSAEGRRRKRKTRRRAMKN